MSGNHWYGNGPPPENRFYGALEEGSENADLMNKLHKELELKKIELLKLQYPTLASIYEDLEAANKDLEDAQAQVKEAQKTKSKLNEELAILTKLYGADDGSRFPLV